METKRDYISLFNGKRSSTFLLSPMKALYMRGSILTGYNINNVTAYQLAIFKFALLLGMPMNVSNFMCFLI
tara:strand:+ start:4859 stop:5071 length:213 start_codon:yes stop_codon:yes gene_type:complete